MHFIAPFVSSLLLASTAVAQRVYVIKVSNKNGSLTYSPNSLTVPVGDMVQWQFYPKDHSVVQAAFNDPCQPISNSMPNMTTFFSGYMPVKPTDTMRPALSMMVTSSKPFWYYCSQGDHCQDGMVGVINPPAPSTGKTVEKFAELAKTAPESTIPGQNVTTTNGTSSTTGTSANGTTSGSTGSSPAPSSPSAAAPAASPSTSKFAGAGNNLVALGFTTFVGFAAAFAL